MSQEAEDRTAESTRTGISGVNNPAVFPHRFLPDTTLAIANPTSGNPTSRQRARRLMALLHERGYGVVQTEYAGHGTELARNAALSGKDGIIVIGGDGTLCEVIADLPTETALAYYPAGSGNNFGYNLLLPEPPEEWLAMLKRGLTRPMRFGLCNDRPFASVASVGFDALLVHKTPGGLKRHLNKGAYVVEFIPTYFTYESPEFKVTIDGQPWNDDVLGVIVGRGPNYGGPHPILPACDPCDERLAYLIMEGRSKWRIGKFAVGMLLDNLPKMDGVTCGTAQTVVVESQPPSYVQLDGNIFGSNPVTFRVDNAVRKILAP